MSTNDSTVATETGHNRADLDFVPIDKNNDLS